MSYYTQTYSALLDDLKATHSYEDAMQLFVGGQFAQLGYLEEQLLSAVGMTCTSSIVDVGCGSGRLPIRIKDSFCGKYIGTDLFPEVLEYARAQVNCEHFEFIQVDSCRIPIPAGWADIVTFFSVFTHLIDEDCFRYLSEAKRVTKPGGLIVISFLDFDEPWHYPIFEQSLNNPNTNKVLNRFLSKSALQKWCEVLGLNLEQLHTGSHRWIPLKEDIVYDGGRSVSEISEFGQSIALIRVL